ncbi:YtxH domain-containing protein [Salibacterium halotolerans]|uniref:Gas vesicle protein n=1 Tax=Salibacterium halotolerans TaxID=1884432 RepID=A0A1I5VKC6_9BACI|nr:YtxH domain-containing protein [Salibacterium halotolerans]SFQ07929.1 Gas vesicle protein [Salibacterium halotolerans]
MSDMNTKDFVIGTLIGGIVGACSALLMAPKSGRELRGELSEGAYSAKEKTNEMTSSAYEKGSQWAGYAREKSSEIAKNVSEQSSQLYGKVKETASSGNEGSQEKTADELAEEISEDLEAEQEGVNNVKEDVRDLHASTEEKDQT